MFKSLDRAPRSRSLLGMVVAGALIVASCGNSGDDDDDAGPATTESDEPTTTAGSEPTTTEASEETTATSADDETTTSAATETTAGTGTFEPISGVPGVTDEEIAFAAVGTKNSPLGGCTLDCYVQGIEAYFAYRNEDGGVNGRQLRLAEVVDDEVGNNQVKTLEVVQSASTFGIFAAPTIASGFPDAAGAGVPIYGLVQQAPEAAGYDSIFTIGGSRCISCTAPYYVNTALIAGATSVASLGYGVSQASKDCVAGQTASIERWGPEVGVEVGYSNDQLAFGLPNGIAPEVTAMKDAGVGLILTCLDQGATTTLRQELERQGMSDVVVTLPSGLGDPNLLADTGGLFEGDIASSNWVPYQLADSSPAMARFLEWIGQIGDENTNLDYAIQGWIDADIAYQGILAAGPQFDQATVIAATNELEDYTADGLTSPTDWGRQHTPPTEDDAVTTGPDPVCLSWSRVENGEWVVVGDPATPWQCWDPREYDTWLEPTRTSFE